MKILQFDIIEGFKKDGIMAFEGDNKSESYLITLLKNKRRYILSDKTVKMIMLNKETKEGDFFEIEIINPERGEIKIDVTDKLTKEDGRFVCQLVIDGADGFKENSVLFYVSIKKSLVNEISGEIIADPSFKILTDALVKVDEWSKYFEETSGKIEEKYAERLNEINSQLSEKTNRTETERIQQQINNLVLESGGDSNTEVVQSRGVFDVLNDRLDHLEFQTPITGKVKDVVSGTPNTSGHLRVNNDPFPITGYLKKITCHFLKASSGKKIKFYILNKTNSTFTVVKEIASVIAIEGLNTFKLEEPVSVQKGQYLGYYGNKTSAEISGVNTEMHQGWGFGIEGMEITSTWESTTIIQMRYNLITHVIKTSSLLNDLKFTDKKYVDNVDSSLKKLVYSKEIPFDILYSSLNTQTGDVAVSDKRVTLILDEHSSPSKKAVSFNKNNSFKIMLFEYDLDDVYLKATPWLDEVEYTTSNKIKILIANTDDSNASNITKEVAKELISIKVQDSNDKGFNENYYFRSEPIDDIKTGVNAVKYNDFISEYWEVLRANNSNYISRSEVINDTSGQFTIYEYVFAPRNYEKTVFLTAGIHGDEYEGFYGLYYLMKNITEKSYKYKQLRDIKHNIRFVVIPVLNPWGVENRTRATSRISNANNNYDVMFDATEYEHDGAYAFSENESKAVKLIADKYDGEIDLYFDFHTDHYDPQHGDYILLDATSSNRNGSVNLTLDEINYLKDTYKFTTVTKPNIVNINRRCSSFKYMNIVRKIPSAIIEVGTGRISPVGSSESITRGVNWYTNVLVDAIKNDYKKNKYNKDFEKAVIENRIVAYSNSIKSNISDEGLQVWLDYNDFEISSWKNKANRGEVVLDGLFEKREEGIVFNNSLIRLPQHKYSDYTIFLKGRISSDGRILSSEDDSLKLSALVSSQPTRFNICQEVNPMHSSLLKYNEEVSICVRSENGVKDLYVNGEPFVKIEERNQTQNNLLIGSQDDKSNSVGMTLKTLMVYDRSLKEDEIGFVFKAI